MLAGLKDQLQTKSLISHPSVDTYTSDQNTVTHLINSEAKTKGNGKLCLAKLVDRLQKHDWRKKAVDTTQNAQPIKSKMGLFSGSCWPVKHKRIQKQCPKTAQNVLTVLLEVTKTFVPNLHFSHSVALTTYSNSAEVPCSF